MLWWTTRTCGFCCSCLARLARWFAPQARGRLRTVHMLACKLKYHSIHAARGTAPRRVAVATPADGGGTDVRRPRVQAPRSRWCVLVNVPMVPQRCLHRRCQCCTCLDLPLCQTVRRNSNALAPADCSQRSRRGHMAIRDHTYTQTYMAVPIGGAYCGAISGESWRGARAS